MNNMETGLRYTSTLLVTEAHTAVCMGSGDLPVLATPAMMCLMENAAMKAVAQALPEGSTTVGASITSTHLCPTAVGKTVQATATLTAVEGRRLTFDLSASDEKGTLIGSGTHVRYIVDKERFLSKI